jgi:hypothetical protein
MPQLSEIEVPKPPPGTLELPPDVWATTYEQRPTEPVTIGIRMLAQYDRQEALKQAVKYTEENGGDEDTFLDAAVRMVVANAVCDPNDAEQPFALMSYPHEHVFLLLTESGARYIFDAYQKVEVETSPRYLEATPDEVGELCDMLAAGGLDELDQADRATVLRHLRFAFEILADIEGAEAA